MWKRSISQLVCIAATVFWLPAGGAQANDYTVMTPDRIPGWEAVGRVTRSRIGDRATCTGTLVTPNKVLTAAHCVSTQFEKGPTAARTLIFQAGKSGTSVIEVGRVTRITYHPDWRPGVRINQNLRVDLAVLHLESPMEDVVPVEVNPIIDHYELVSFLGHRADGRNPPRLKEECSQILRDPRVLEIGCRAIGGNSGAGVFIGDGEERRLVAVMSAAGEARSYATIPDDWLFGVLSLP